MRGKDPIEGTHTIYGFLTTEPNAVVAPVHSKAMPVILTMRRKSGTSGCVRLGMRRRRCSGRCPMMRYDLEARVGKGDALDPTQPPTEEHYGGVILRHSRQNPQPTTTDPLGIKRQPSCRISN
jgi:hypothetical protein